MKFIFFLVSFLIAAGAGCAPQTTSLPPSATETKPVETPAEAKFDASDYLDQALDELEATK